jgi:arginase
MGMGGIRTGLDAIHRVKTPTPPFLSLPKTVAIIGAPMMYGQPFAGADLGPQALRDRDLHSACTKLGWRVAEQGDLTFDSPSHADPEFKGPGLCKLSFVVGTGTKKIAAKVKEQAEKGRFVLTIGGDHSIGIGTLAGVLQVRPDSGVIWVDAHADINTPSMSPTGNMHGMPLAFLLGLVDVAGIPGCEWLANIPKLKPEQVSYVGLRDIDIGERDILRKLNIQAFTMHHVDKFGIGKVMEMILDHQKKRPLHVSYDIDACDPAIAPSTGTRVRGGLSYCEAHYVAEAVAETGRLGSVDMVEVNPVLAGGESDNGETADLGLALVADLLGNRML